MIWLPETPAFEWILLGQIADGGNSLKETVYKPALYGTALVQLPCWQ